MTRELKEVVSKFGAYVASIMDTLSKYIDTRADLMYGEEGPDCEESPYRYVALPIKNLENEGLDKDAIDKLYSTMAFFVDNVIGSGNIYLTQREDTLVIEIAWN